MGKLKLTKLSKFSNEEGEVFHIYKDISQKVKEVYLSSVIKNKIKGWKKHRLMTLNIVVISGNIEFFIMSEDFKLKKTITIGDRNYCRLTIPPNFWVAFKGLDTNNTLINVADISHDPEESESKKLEDMESLWKLS